MNAPSEIKRGNVLSGPPAMIWPVYGFHATERYRQEPVATFFRSGDAEDFVMHPERHGFEKRNLYIGRPQYASKVRKTLTDRIEAELRFTIEQQRNAA